MTGSILNNTKKILGLEPFYSPFDLDIIIHINAAFSVLNQLGIGPDVGFSIEDESTEWDAFITPENQKHLVKTYIYLKVRMVFDPPQTSYLITAMEKQIAEIEWRLSCLREMDVYPLETLLEESL